MENKDNKIQELDLDLLDQVSGGTPTFGQSFKYTCRLCGGVFDSFTALAEHRTTEHNSSNN